MHPESLMEYLHDSTSAMRGRKNVLSCRKFNNSLKFKDPGDGGEVEW